jgi:S-adenosylmethionine hydrolase
MITLASDFGTPYPAAMKGAILRESEARLVDVSHEFPRQDVRTAAFWLREVLPEFPPAVHLVVVDPGVGTDRAALVVRAGDHALVGPDNGVLLPPARALAGADDIEVYDLAIGDPRSTTFHGRDVFAPGAAAVHEAGIDRIGSVEGVSPYGDPVDLRFPDPEPFEGGVRGEVLVVDGFGNAVTNVPGDVLDGRERVRIDGAETPVVRSYAAVDPGTAVATIGSHGNVELAVNRGRGEAAFGVAPGDAVEIEV